ncbi:MAG: DMT family transporter [Archaeoglobaceae archaeon]
MLPALIATTIVWGASFVFIKLALHLGSFNLAFYRFLIATPFLYLALRGKISGVRLQDVPGLILLALTGVTLLYAVQFVALKYTTATNASILINTSAVFVALLSVLLGERLGAKTIAGMFVALAGAVLIVSNGKIDVLSSETLVGDLLMTFDGFLWAIYTVAGKAMLERYSPETLTFYAFAFGTILLFPFAVAEGLATRFDLIAIVSILFLAIFCSVFAYVVWYRALEVMGAARVAVFVYLIPLTTALVAHFTLGEEITIFTTLGGALVLLGVYLVES